MNDFPFATVGFDLDGTLLDTSADISHALNHALALIGREPIPLPQARGLIGGGTRKLLDRALDLTGGALLETEIATLNRQLVEFYGNNIAVHSRLFPGGEAMLDALAARGVALAVVTNKLEHLARKLLDTLGLSERFYTIIGGDTLGPGRAKPAPDLLHEMVARTPRIGPVAYVGDTTYDTGAAKAAGIPCVAVSFGFCDLPPAELGARAVIDHFDELVNSLQALR